MEQDQFWALVQTLGSRPGDDDFERLTDQLATRGAGDIIDFEDRLAALLHALDTPAHAAAARARGDWFLYVRCAAVAAGHSAYREVVAEPAKLRRFARREAELLLSVAQNAYERSTGMLWEHEAALSYESGSNTTAWGEPPPGEVQSSPPPAWLSLHCVVHLPDGWPAAYAALFPHIGQAVIGEPAWDPWWSPAGIPECHWSLTLQADEDLGPTGITVKVGRSRVEVHSIQRPEPFTSTDPEELLPRAIAETLTLLEAVRARLGLSPLPQIPRPELPADLPRGIEHPMTVPRLLSELGGRNLLPSVASGLLGRLRRGRPKP